MISESILALLAPAIRQAERVLVVSHIRPDGDAIGSLLGFGLSLETAGKQVQMVLADGVPSSFRHLPGSRQVVNKPTGSFDMVCTVDCADLKRAGNILEGFSPPDLNIDHHITNENFAKINLVDPKAVATAEILTELIIKLELPLTQPVAASLLTGIITDTLGFHTSNMTPTSLRLSADLMEVGVDLPVLYQRALINRSYEATRFWGKGLSQMERKENLVWTTLTLADRNSVGYSGRDDADLINVLSAIDNANIALVFVEQANEHVKVSWRAQPGYDVSGIATRYGGGGHPAAAGADIPVNLDEVRAMVLQATRQILGGDRGG